MRKIIALALLTGLSKAALAQGCSDAGFCTIGNLSHQPSVSRAAAKQYLKLTLPLGLGDENVFVFTPGVEYGLQLARWQFSGKLTGNHASGDLGNATGADDVFLSATYQVSQQQKWRTSVTLGTKLPLNQGNLKENGLSLPMQYQSSLGTVDAIVGVALVSNRWNFAAGWQQPLTGINRNNFLPQYWPNGKAMAFPPTNDFNRKGDVLLRSAYRLVEKEKWSLDGGLLGIYHLGEDTYIDANRSNRPLPIEGSQGLTLNATAAVEWPVSKRWSLGFTGGVPLVVRKVRPTALPAALFSLPTFPISFKYTPMKHLFLSSLCLVLLACKKEGASETPAMDTVQNGAATLGRGNFQSGPYGRVTGIGKVVRNTNATYDVVLDSFETNNGPDLYVYLSKEIMPVQFVEAGKLKATSGKQVYPLSGVPDLSQYKYICIHCKAFNHLFGYALLQ